MKTLLTIQTIFALLCIPLIIWGLTEIVLCIFVTDHETPAWIGALFLTNLLVIAFIDWLMKRKYMKAYTDLDSTINDITKKRYAGLKTMLIKSYAEELEKRQDELIRD